jgi:hypothetical protein
MGCPDCEKLKTHPFTRETATEDVLYYLRDGNYGKPCRGSLEEAALIRSGDLETEIQARLAGYCCYTCVPSLLGPSLF